MENEEISHIAISVLSIVIAFTMEDIIHSPQKLAFTFPLILITVGLAFVLHELAHKFTAQRYGAKAIYRAWPEGLLLMLGTAFMAATLGFGIIFAAPGAVYIYAQRLTIRESGIISLSGPLANLFLAGIFNALIIYSPFLGPIKELIIDISALGEWINLFLAFFNMLPIPPLDGSKVFYWDGRIWFAVILIIIFLYLF